MINKRISYKLNDEELSEVNGGTLKKSQLMRVACSNCGEVFEADVQKSSVICPSCKKPVTFSG